MAVKDYRRDAITQGVIWKEMLRFVAPIMLGTLLQQLYNTVDAVVLNEYVGKQALAAVGGSDTAIIWLIVNGFVGLSSGAGIVIAQHYGAGDRQRLQQGVHTAILLGLICGGIMTVLGVFLAPKTLVLLDTPEDTLQYSIDYLHFYFLGMIPSMLYNMGSGILRAVGDSRRPLYYLMACTAVNIVLDLLFVGGLHMEVAGAAIATTLSQVVCAVLVLRALLCSRDVYRLEPSKLHMDRKELGAMLRIGLPAALQSSMFNICNLLLQSAINSMGTDHVAAWSGVWKLDGIYWPICNAIGATVMTFVGQNYGAGRKDRIRQTIRSGIVIHMTLSVLVSTIMCLGRWTWMGFFAKGDPVVLQSGVNVMLYMMPFYVLFSCTEVLSGAMRGVGKAITSTGITLFGICILRIVYLYTVIRPNTTDFTVAMCYPLTWGITSLMFVGYYFISHWMDKLPCERPEGQE